MERSVQLRKFLETKKVRHVSVLLEQDYVNSKSGQMLEVAEPFGPASAKPLG